MSWIARARALTKAALEPVSQEKRNLLAERWAELPTALQTPQQAVGRQLTHCGYTLGASYCSFGCTHCYLPRNANQAPIPSLEEMKAQVDANRRLLGDDGALQITGGDVLDAYWREGRIDELVEILAYASAAGTVPMLMTHGQVLLDHPDVFDRLVTEGHLTKVAIHIDITQAGRPGYPIRALEDEAQLHPLRQRFVDLILDVRRRTGCAVSAAHTVTVTAANLGSISSIVSWLLDEPRRLDAFRMLSFQTEADVGRTRMGTSTATPEAVWAEVERAAGTRLGRGAFSFGDPRCSSQAIALRVETGAGRRVIDALPAGQPTESFVAALLRTFGGVGSRGPDAWLANVRRTSLLLRRPGVLWALARHVGHVRRSAGLTRREAVRAALRRGTGAPRALNLVQHNFMSARDVADPDQATQERLAACAFRGATRRNGEWVAVPMCEINAGPREALYELKIRRPSSHPVAALGS